MNKLPVVAETDYATLIPAEKAGEPVVYEEQPPPSFSRFPFFSYFYCRHEITWVNRQTRVRSRQARLVDGQFQTVEFDASFGAAAYAEALARTQHLMARQTSFLLRQFSSFLPFWGR